MSALSFTIPEHQPKIATELGVLIRDRMQTSSAPFDKDVVVLSEVVFELTREKRAYDEVPLSLVAWMMNQFGAKFLKNISRPDKRSVACYSIRKHDFYTTEIRRGSDLNKHIAPIPNGFRAPWELK